MNWELIIKLVIALGTVAIGAMQLRAKLVDDRREREYRQPHGFDRFRSWGAP